MCGIIGAFNYGKGATKVNDFIAEQYQDQISRGTRGFGAVFIKKDGTYEISRATEQTKILIDLYLKDTQMAIFHHRTPTSSENKISQTHPMVIDQGSFKRKYVIIHNGVIYKYQKLNEYHTKELGLNYSTHRKVNSTYKDTEFNDSESFSIELARFIEKQTPKVMIDGSYAFIALEIDKKTDKIVKIHYGRNDKNPLNLAARQGELKLSSEGPGDAIKEDTLYSVDFKTWKTGKRAMPQAKDDEVEEMHSPKTEEEKIEEMEAESAAQENNYWNTRVKSRFDEWDDDYVSSSYNSKDNDTTIDKRVDYNEHDIETAIEIATEDYMDEIAEKVSDFEESLRKEDILFGTDTDQIIASVLRDTAVALKKMVSDARDAYMDEVMIQSKQRQEEEKEEEVEKSVILKSNIAERHYAK